MLALLLTKPLLHTSLCVALLLSFCSWGYTSPLPFFSAEYEATIKGFSIQALREFKPLDGLTHELHFEATSLLAGIEERSQFSWDNTQLMPLHYSYKRTVMGKKRTKELTFDKNSQYIASNDNEQAYTIPRQHNALDNLSYQLQLQYDLLAAKTKLHYKVADKNRLKDYQFNILGDEVINTTLGKLNTTKVSLKHNTDQRITYIWFAKDWHYLLTRFEQFEKGKKAFVIQLTKAVVDDAPVTGLQ